jgi:hypothetical protein
MNSVSLKNQTLAPGWTPEEVEVLKIALMKFGIGRWKKIMQSGCLSGKTSSQLSSQTQRLLGQQSLAEYLHLHLDIDKVAQYNYTRTDVIRKSNCIINTGKNPNPEELQRLREFNAANFGISLEETKKLKLPAINTLTRIMNLQAEPLVKLKQLHEYRNQLLKRLKKAR